MREEKNLLESINDNIRDPDPALLDRQPKWCLPSALFLSAINKVLMKQKYAFVFCSKKVWQRMKIWMVISKDLNKNIKSNI